MSKVLCADHTNATETRTPGGGVRVTIPIRLRHRGGRKEIVLPPDTTPDGGKRSVENTALVTALARAYRWTELIESGRYRSMADLAASHKLDKSYVCKLLGMVNLAPDIVQALLDGEEPDGFTLQRLRKGIPVLWEDQRKQFGFPRPIEATTPTHLAVGSTCLPAL